MNNIINSFTGEYSFLSNFYKLDNPVMDNDYNIKFYTVENAYQANKTLDYDERILFSTVTPGKAKKLGKTVKLRDNWEAGKTLIMFNLLLQKFINNKDLFQKLIDTKDARLVEGNYWHDSFWGVDNNTGIGDNILGKLLMQIRTLNYKKYNECCKN